MSTIELKNLYEDYNYCMVCITVLTKEGDLSNGAGFHIGDGIIVTARHVVENLEIQGIKGHYDDSIKIEEICFPSDENVDLAVLRTNFNLDYYMEKVSFVGSNSERRNKAKTDLIPLGYHLDDWIDDEFILSKVLLMGYPLVPFSDTTKLVTVTGEVNAIIDKYNAPHPHFIISSTARGGFSGGPVFSEYGFLLGVLTESLIMNGKDEETGFASVLSVEPLLILLKEHGIKPKDFNEAMWNDFRSGREMTLEDIMSIPNPEFTRVFQDEDGITHELGKVRVMGQLKEQVKNIKRKIEDNT